MIGMRFLILRPGAIGDTLLAFPVLRALQAQYTHSHITFVGNASVLSLALAFGVAEEALDYEHVQWSQLFSTRGIHAPALQDLLQRIDSAICWLHDPEGLVEHNLRLAGVRHVIVAPGRPRENMHIVEHLARTIGFEKPVETLTRFTLPGSGAAYLDKVVAVHPGSGGTNKCWPARHFAAVIERLWNLPGQDYPVLLLSGPADQERMHDLLSWLAPPEPALLKVIVNEPLLAVAHQLQQCRCYLGNDSGITHLAAMLGVPTIALFGPSDPAAWRPVGPEVIVLREAALEQLSIDAVMDALDAVLGV
jgi:ADP-heptose:LPS heptosyltransferase